jgi:hypothetical protein
MSHRWRSLQYDMFAILLAQVVADRESRLTTSYDDRINFLQHGYLLKSELRLDRLSSDAPRASPQSSLWL